MVANIESLEHPRGGRYQSASAPILAGAARLSDITLAYWVVLDRVHVSAQLSCASLPKLAKPP